MVRLGAFACVIAVISACDDPPLPAKSADDAPAPATALAATADQTDLAWPLPLPSTSMEIPSELRAPAAPGDHLTRPADWLAKALHAAGYQELVWYDIPEGFALVPGLELTDDQGLGLVPPDAALRFSASWPREGFFTMRFWSQLLVHKTGRFRALVFVVVDHPFGYSKDITDAEPVIWKHPSRTLPLSRADLAYKAQDKWYMLVYEFEHGAGEAAARLVERPTDPAVHLEKSGIRAALEQLAKTPAP
jgi:hypothetical protein